ncbi:Receptor-like kinase [Melia azedarach]|uniref:Receptor-like kinase n=1 Tax=Melia azedarach TaxID=155640 RepID=A0ACC1Y562_MELAZ|nr:Receptor-like kinase [Melia azedarach]
MGTGAAVVGFAAGHCLLLCCCTAWILCCWYASCDAATWIIAVTRFFCWFLDCWCCSAATNCPSKKSADSNLELFMGYCCSAASTAENCCLVGVLLEGGDIYSCEKAFKSIWARIEELKNESTAIAKVQHTNLVRLLGSYNDKNEKTLIYKCMPNKSLDFLPLCC